MALLKRKRSGLSDPMSVVTRFVNACNRHDADGVSACLHPDFDSIQPMYPARNFRGADQVRRNWQAIFDAEPGFRLTVLRQAATDDTVWLELHGAGRDAEVAGVFVMGIQGDRVRWARIYSALIEPTTAETEPTSPANLREVPPLGDGSTAGGVGAPAGEDAIASVVDIEGGGRTRRRRSRRRSEEVAGSAGETGGSEAEGVPAEADDEPAADEVDASSEPDAAAAEPNVVDAMIAGDPVAEAEVTVPAAPVVEDPVENLWAQQEGADSETVTATPAPDTDAEDTAIVWAADVESAAADVESAGAEATGAPEAPGPPDGAGGSTRKRGRKRR